MVNMLQILQKAKQQKTFENQSEFKEVLHKIQEADMDLTIDWDDGAGEEWATFGNLKEGKVGMMNAKLRLVFIRESYHFPKIEHVLADFEVVFIKDYSSCHWSIDLHELQKEIPEIYWHAPEHAVNSKCFSLDDLYFATI